MEEFVENIVTCAKCKKIIPGKPKTDSLAVTAARSLTPTREASSSSAFRMTCALGGRCQSCHEQLVLTIAENGAPA